LWFDFFTPYYRTKLWNRLSFSEDYLINIINTPKLSRQDLAIKVTKALCNIKRDFLEMLLGWVESNKWYMTGGIYSVDEEGNRMKEL